MRFAMKLHAGSGEVFTEAAAQSLIGQEPALNIRQYDGGPLTADVARARVVAVEVVDDGRAMAVTVEVSA